MKYKIGVLLTPKRTCLALPLTCYIKVSNLTLVDITRKRAFRALGPVTHVVQGRGGPTGSILQSYLTFLQGTIFVEDFIEMRSN